MIIAYRTRYTLSPPIRKAIGGFASIVDPTHEALTIPLNLSTLTPKRQPPQTRLALRARSRITTVDVNSYASNRILASDTYLSWNALAMMKSVLLGAHKGLCGQQNLPNERGYNPVFNTSCARGHLTNVTRGARSE